MTCADKIARASDDERPGCARAGSVCASDCCIIPRHIVPINGVNVGGYVYFIFLMVSEIIA